MAKSLPTRSVVITSKDRPALLEKAIESVQQQTVTCELVIVDDGSQDSSTQEMMQQKFPNVVFHRNESPLGIIAARNHAFGLATGDIIFTLDDDAVFAQNDLVEKVLQDFHYPFIGVVTIPLIDHLPDGKVVQRAPIATTREEDFLCSCNFSGGANALRARVFKQIGGYIGNGRQSEERSVAIRFAEQGLFIKIAEQCHIDHFPVASNGNQNKRIVYFNTRNSLAFGWALLPTPDLWWHTLSTIINHLLLGLKTGEIWDALTGCFDGIMDYFRLRKTRKPVSNEVYRLLRHLIKQKRFKYSALKNACTKFNVPSPADRPVQ